MPLPHFLMLLVAIIFVAAVTIWFSLSVGVPLLAFGIVALILAAGLRLTLRNHES